MIFLFAVSNENPEHPVVSPVSGCIYERRLIEKYISENGTDPMNGDQLTKDMLIDVKSRYTRQILDQEGPQVNYQLNLLVT